MGSGRHSLPAPSKHLGTFSSLSCRLQGAQTDPGSLARAKPTFQKEIAATQSAGAAIFDMLAVLPVLTTAVSKRQTNPLLAAEMLCFEKEHRKTVLRLGGAGGRAIPSLSSQKPCTCLVGGRRSDAEVPSSPGEFPPLSSSPVGVILTRMRICPSFKTRSVLSDSTSYHKEVRSMDAGPDFLGSNPTSATCLLGDIKQVLKPHRASVSLSVK